MQLFIKKSQKIVVLIGFLSIVIFNANGQKVEDMSFVITPNLRQAYVEICKFKIISAKNLLDKEPDNNGIKILFNDYIDMITLVNNGNKEEYQSLLQRESYRIALIEKVDIKNPYSRFIKAEIKLHWALVKYIFGDEIKAAWGFIQANKLLKENHELYPNFTLQLKSLGAIHIIASCIPDKYLWITKFLELEGNMKLGENELAIASKDNLFGIEALFYKLLIQTYLLGLDANESTLKSIFKNHEDYLSVCFLNTAIFMRTNKSEQAKLLLFETKWQENQYLKMPIFDYYKGEIFLQKDEYDKATFYYTKFLANRKNDNFKKEVLLKIFFSHWLKNDNTKALSFLQKINKEGSIVTDSDRFSQKFYEKYVKYRYLPNKMLLKSRFDFDAGNYQEALSNIEEVDINKILDEKERIEVYYRKGRIYHKLNKTNMAIDSYLQAVELCKNTDWGFGPSSMLYLGFLYKESGRVEMARNCFKKAISYTQHESKNSIDIRAKAALNNL